MITAPGTFRRSSATMIAKPSSARTAGQAVRSPMVTSVAGWSTMMPAFFRAMMPRNSPMPAEIAIFRPLGMALMIHSRTGRIERITKRMPERKTAPRATCQLWPMPSTTP